MIFGRGHTLGGRILVAFFAAGFLGPFGINRVLWVEGVEVAEPVAPLVAAATRGEARFEFPFLCAPHYEPLSQWASAVSPRAATISLYACSLSLLLSMT